MDPCRSQDPWASHLSFGVPLPSTRSHPPGWPLNLRRRHLNGISFTSPDYSYSFIHSEGTLRRMVQPFIHRHNQFILAGSLSRQRNTRRMAPTFHPRQRTCREPSHSIHGIITPRTSPSTLPDEPSIFPSIYFFYIFLYIHTAEVLGSCVAD
ncbi:Hypothetical protein FKW44_010553 [Caligus rogercresseyi]|uniref:Uncharacterized protein n=1 Tax=Caligus rogercresseyi TaxID=217165 RepID=A0A7T8HGR5_CALRO|nr:Hypothetical protein FKW44_010553 [Caligus rogercresseyi]